MPWGTITNTGPKLVFPDRSFAGCDAAVAPLLPGAPSKKKFNHLSFVLDVHPATRTIAQIPQRRIKDHVLCRVMQAVKRLRPLHETWQKGR
jgi:hypothetical protein